MIILITNDDGINSDGLKALSETLRELGDIFVVAPDRQRSAVGLSITLERPLRVENVGENMFSVDGMPVDCVTLAIHKLMESPPDLIVSGINDGQNIGYDIYHSGTAGAAFVGTMSGIQSMAISIANDRFTGESAGMLHYDTAAQIALRLAKILSDHKLPEETLLNVNVPNVLLSDVQGIEVTRHCGSTYNVEIQHRIDPRGKQYYWVGGEIDGKSGHPETDLDALQRHKVSVTPLRLDITDYTMMGELSSWISDGVVEDDKNVKDS